MAGKKKEEVPAAEAAGTKPSAQPSTGIAGDLLRSFIERIERLTDEKKALQEDIKEVFSEAKGVGFDTKIMRLLIRLRARDQNDIDEEEAILDTYAHALGMKR